MEIHIRLESLVQLGKYIKDYPEFLQSAVRLAGIKNHWFTQENTERALLAIADKMLDSEKLQNWTAQYSLEGITPKNIGIIAAGNIPLVSFHDILCVLITGHNLLLKTSERDQVLTQHLLQKLIEIQPQWSDKIFIDQRWKDQDAVIATGSNNSGRYFEYYFGKNPHIIRKNRHSIAVLNGQESAEQLYLLGRDVFEYFGLGCRNVSLIWLPKDYRFETLLESWQPFSELMSFASYKNNLDYQRTIYLMNNTPIIDCDFVNLVENTSISSPISCVNIAYYSELSEVENWLNAHEDQIQCVVNFNNFNRSADFGQAQEPELHEYADGIDTMQFLTDLK